MTNYGAITIDNKNLLEDLLGLEGEYADVSPPNTDNDLYSNAYTQNQQQPPSYLTSGKLVQGRKQFLESPTFAKGEDDIYR